MFIFGEFGLKYKIHESQTHRQKKSYQSFLQAWQIFFKTIMPNLPEEHATIPLADLA